MAVITCAIWSGASSFARQTATMSLIYCALGFWVTKRCSNSRTWNGATEGRLATIFIT